MGRRGITRRVAAVAVAALALSGILGAQNRATPGRGPALAPSPPDKPAAAGVTERIDLTREEREIFDRTNEYRVKCGLPPVTLNAQLTRAARYFAIYMSITGDFDHDADGRGPGARAAKFGYNWSLVCENIAYRYKAYDTSLHDLPSDFVGGWIRSAGHRKNMLCDEVVETGIGVALAKNPRHQYSVQVFGKQRGATYTFKVVNDSGIPVRYVLGRQVFTLRPRHTRVHPDSEEFPTQFESVSRDGRARPIFLPNPDAPAPSYHLVRDRTGAVTVTTGPP